MGGEDFSYVLQRIPGAMAFLGVAERDRIAGEAAPLHNPGYDYADAALPGTIAYLVALTRRRLGA